MSDDLTIQVGTLALVPQIVQKVRIPVIAAGGIADSKGVAAAMTLGIFSFLAGDNPFYKFTENLFVGVSAAYWMVTGFW